MGGALQGAGHLSRCSLEAKLVHGHGQVSGLTEALVGVAVVHGDQVHVAEDEALVVVLLGRLHVAHVQQLGSVEGFLSVLRRHKRTSVPDWTRGKGAGEYLCAHEKQRVPELLANVLN